MVANHQFTIQEIEDGVAYDTLKVQYQRRWVGFGLAVTSVFILSSANISTQWIGWLLSVIACVMWVYFGYKDRDWYKSTYGVNVFNFKYEGNV